MSGRRAILLIDDEPVVIDSCLAILEGTDHDVAFASSGVEGLELARAHRPDLAFVDLKMPGMSGMEVLEELRTLDPTIVSIVFTGFATIASAVEAMQRGAYDFLPKPFTPDEFRSMLRRGLNQGEMLVERAALRREREALRENFAAIVSHELRSPLAAVQQNLYVLLRDLDGAVSADQHETLERMSRRIGELLALVNRWLRGFSTDLAPVRETFEPVEIAAVVTNAVENARPEATRKAIEIAAHVDPGTVVLGDAGALTEAVLNLVGNAVKYSRQGGRVAIRATCREGRVLLSVVDHGVGIAPADLPRVFDAFYRGQAAEGGVAGAGIGLALSRRIVEAHDGQISVTSDQGEGTVFVIELPALQAPAPGPEGAPPGQLSKGEAR